MKCARSNLGKQAWQCQRASAALEFAIIVPLLFLLFVGIVELHSAYLLRERLDKIAYTMADFVAQASTIDANGNAQTATAGRGNLDLAVNSTADMMGPLNGNRPVAVAFTMITNGSLDAPPPCKNTNGPCVLWQYNKGVQSRIAGAPGSAATLPAAFQMQRGENYLVAEVSYEYSPFFTDIIADWIPGLHAQTLYRYSVNRPRSGGVILLR